MDTAPELLTLGQAARASNRSKATISRAVRSGRLPAKASEDNAGGWLIRRDDLDRVFPMQTVAERSPPADTEPLRIELEGLRERLHGTAQRLSDAVATIADLRIERDRLLAIIETQAAQLGARRSWWRWRR